MNGRRTEIPPQKAQKGGREAGGSLPRKCDGIIWGRGRLIPGDYCPDLAGGEIVDIRLLAPIAVRLIFTCKTHYNHWGSNQKLNERIMNSFLVLQRSTITFHYLTSKFAIRSSSFAIHICFYKSPPGGFRGRCSRRSGGINDESIKTKDIRQ
jgi:hypothetical protein